MKILSIDPGQSTGICIYDSTDEHIELDTLTPLETEELLSDNTLRPDVIIIETSPIHGAVRQYVLVQRLCILAGSRCEKLVTVTPGLWKPLAKARNWANHCALDNHQRDAYFMLKWYMLTQQGKTPGGQS